MSAAITAVAASALIGGVMKNQAQVKANKAADAAAVAGQVDIGALDEQTRQIALRNAKESMALEKQLTPEVSDLKKNSITGLNAELSKGMDPGMAKGQALLTGQIGQDLNTPLMKAAIAKAQSNLALGGKLSLDQQNAATRSGAAAAANAGGGLGLGRDLAARDLGMTSYQVEQQRLNDASKIGQQEVGLATDNSTNLLNTLQALKGISDSQYNKYLSASTFGQQIAAPTVGLDPTAIANLKTGNASNASAALTAKANQYGAQGNANLQLGGTLAGGFMQYGGKLLAGAKDYFNKPPADAQGGGGLF